LGRQQARLVVAVVGQSAVGGLISMHGSPVSAAAETPSCPLHTGALAGRGLLPPQHMDAMTQIAYS
jgi:hypothetical protein